MHTSNIQISTSLMAFPLAPSQALILAVAVTHLGLATCSLLKGSISCFDCSPHYDFSGVEVGVQCKDEKSHVSAFTNRNGYFEVKLSFSSTSQPSECIAILLGGPEQLCSFKKSMVSKVVKASGSHDYNLSSPLSFMSSCPYIPGDRPKEAAGVGSSKTVSLPQWPPMPPLPPLPRGWALAPDYLRFFPIIGIP